MPITDIALRLRHGMLYKKLVLGVTKMLDRYIIKVAQDVRVSGKHAVTTYGS